MALNCFIIRYKTFNWICSRLENSSISRELLKKQWEKTNLKMFFFSIPSVNWHWICQRCLEGDVARAKTTRRAVSCTVGKTWTVYTVYFRFPFSVVHLTPAALCWCCGPVPPLPPYPPDTMATDKLIWDVLPVVWFIHVFFFPLQAQLLSHTCTDYIKICQFWTQLLGKEKKAQK